MTRSPSPSLIDTAIIALGSNLGDSRRLLNRAFECLRQLSDGEFKASRLWRSTPVDCPPNSPDFLNAVCLLEPNPSETPDSFLDQLQAIERGFGRTPKTVHNEPRPLDLDLIAFGGARRTGERLTLPHPRAHVRRFVLGPLQEIAPDLVLPGWDKTVSEMLLDLPQEPDVRVILSPLDPDNP